MSIHRSHRILLVRSCLLLGLLSSLLAVGPGCSASNGSDSQHESDSEADADTDTDTDSDTDADADTDSDTDTDTDSDTDADTDTDTDTDADTDGDTDTDTDADSDTGTGTDSCSDASDCAVYACYCGECNPDVDIRCVTNTWAADNPCLLMCPVKYCPEIETTVCDCIGSNCVKVR